MYLPPRRTFLPALPSALLALTALALTLLALPAPAHAALDSKALVLMGDGSTKPIGQVQVGDTVETSRSGLNQTVTFAASSGATTMTHAAVYLTMSSAMGMLNQSIVVSSDQLFMSSAGPVPASQLTNSSNLQGPFGSVRVVLVSTGVFNGSLSQLIAGDAHVMDPSDAPHTLVVNGVYVGDFHMQLLYEQ